MIQETDLYLANPIYITASDFLLDYFGHKVQIRADDETGSQSLSQVLLQGIISTVINGPADAKP